MLEVEHRSRRAGSCGLRAQHANGPDVLRGEPRRGRTGSESILGDGGAGERRRPSRATGAPLAESWLLHRVAEAVESNEVSATLLTDLHAAIVEIRARPPEARDGLALMDLAERVYIPVDELTNLLATLEA